MWNANRKPPNGGFSGGYGPRPRTRQTSRMPLTSAASIWGRLLQKSRLLPSRGLNPIADCRFKYVNVDGI